MFYDVDDDEDYVQENDQELTIKRKKYQYIQDLSDDFIEDPVPKEYRYIWTGLQNAHPEYQVLIEKMLSVYHMSYEKLRLLFEKQLMNYFIGRNMDNENLTIVMFLWMLTHYFNKRMLEITHAVWNYGPQSFSWGYHEESKQ